MNRQDTKNAKKRSLTLHHALLWLTFILLVSGCAVVNAQQHMRIALFAPFEGRYREIGYNALYAARLAIAESSNRSVDLLAVDAGGTEAANRAAALAQDPLVMAVIVLGYDATTPEVLHAFGDIPVLVVGEWGAQPVSDNVFIFSNAEIAGFINTPPRISVTDAAELSAPIVGTDVMALEGFAKLRFELDGVTVLSSGVLPDAEFTARYKGDDPFAPEPGLLATLVFDATQLSSMVAQSGERATAARLLHDNARDIRFEGGYWANAPLHRYVYVNGVLTDNTVEQR